MKKLYLITIEARPAPHSEAFSEAGGACINAWIDSPTQEEALERATAEIRDAGWIVEEVQDISIRERSDYADDDPNLEYFDQALVDREVCVFHTWPVEAQEDDILH